MTITLTKLFMRAFLPAGFLISFIGFSPVLADDAVEVNATAAPTAWSVKFHLSEYTKSPGGEKNATTHLELAGDGKFSAQRATTTGDSAPLSSERNGTLSAEELAFLSQSLNLLDMAVLGNQKLDIGYGATLRPGWEGSLLIQREGQPSKVEFTSLRAQDETSRSQQMNRLVTVVFDLKRIMDQRFNAD